MKKTLTSVLAIALVFTVLCSLSGCLGIGGDTSDQTRATVKEAGETKSAAPTDSLAVLEYFNKVVNAVKTEKPSVSREEKIDVPNSSVKFTRAGQGEDEKNDDLEIINKAAPELKKLIVADITKKSQSVVHGANNTELMYVPGEGYSSALTAADIIDASCTVSDTTYTIVIRLQPETDPKADGIMARSFGLEDKESILKEFDKTKDYLTAKDYTAEYSGCTIKATVDATKDQVTKIEYYKAAKITSEVTPLGPIEGLKGDKQLVLNLEYKKTTNFNLDWTADEG
ncbi:MAG: hypothetical protein GX051_01135 [Clostridiales bacterium]|nr:hypothetical protein [Clostridiales bacterium]